jgi:hypothetical protein
MRERDAARDEHGQVHHVVAEHMKQQGLRRFGAGERCSAVRGGTQPCQKKCGDRSGGRHELAVDRAVARGRGAVRPRRQRGACEVWDEVEDYSARWEGGLRSAEVRPVAEETLGCRSGCIVEQVSECPNGAEEKQALEDGGAVLRLGDWNGRSIGEWREVMRVRERVADGSALSSGTPSGRGMIQK